MSGVRIVGNAAGQIKEGLTMWDLEGCKDSDLHYEAGGWPRGT